MPLNWHAAGSSITRCNCSPAQLIAPGHRLRPSILGRRVLRRDGNHLQACVRRRLHIEPSGGRPGMARSPLFRDSRFTGSSARPTICALERLPSLQAHRLGRAHLHDIHPPLLRHERTARTRIAHIAVPIHLDRPGHSDDFHAPSASRMRNSSRSHHPTWHRIRERTL